MPEPASREGVPPGPGDPFPGTQLLVFALVAAVFTTVSIPQPALPMLRQELGAVAIPGAALLLPLGTGLLEVRAGRASA